MSHLRRKAVFALTVALLATTLFTPLAFANPKADKILSMYPLLFEEALRGALQVAPPPKEPKEQKKQAPRQQKRTTGKRTHKQS